MQTIETGNNSKAQQYTPAHAGHGHVYRGNLIQPVNATSINLGHPAPPPQHPSVPAASALPSAISEGYPLCHDAAGNLQFASANAAIVSGTESSYSQGQSVLLSMVPGRDFPDTSHPNFLTHSRHFSYFITETFSLTFRTSQQVVSQLSVHPSSSLKFSLIRRLQLQRSFPLLASWNTWRLCPSQHITTCITLP